MKLGIAFIFTAIMAALGMWSMWQRRDAWGIWESPRTTNTFLLTVSAILVAPIFALREIVWWWGYSYLAGAVLCFIALANFAALLRGRVWPRVKYKTLAQIEPDRTKSNFVVGLTAAGIACVIALYFACGAGTNPWILVPTDNQPILARLFWMSIAVLLTYQLAVIARCLLHLRKDPRRTDKGSVNAYLTVCVAGMLLALIAVTAAHGYGENMATMIVGSILTGVLTAGNTGISALSWRNKTGKGKQFTMHQCPEFASSFPQPASRCSCQRGDTHQQ